MGRVAFAGGSCNFTVLPIPHSVCAVSSADVTIIFHQVSKKTGRRSSKKREKEQTNAHDDARLAGFLSKCEITINWIGWGVGA